MSKKYAFITGGAKGIGRAISEKLAADGWDLVLCGRDRSALELAKKELSDRHSAAVRVVEADLSSPSGPDAAAADWGGSLPDALICNAGDYGALGKLTQVDFGEWKRSFDLGFFSTARLLQLYLERAGKSRAQHRRKVIVMSGSGLGGSQIHPGISAYACAKAALYRLVEVAHAESYYDGIDINCVAPGFVKTGITRQAVEAGPEKLGDLFSQSDQVLREGGTSPDLAAETISMLLSPACDGVSGRLISAKWDRKLLSSTETIDRLNGDADLLRLRRIDDDLFSRKK